MAEVFQDTKIKDVEINNSEVEIITESGDLYQADYIVDAGGFRSLLANKFKLRDYSLQTYSRAIFTHMVNVSCYQQTETSVNFNAPFCLSEGTLHHVFEGGWLWIIPFNNHDRATNPLCSVGLMLNLRLHPIQKDLSPEAEFYRKRDLRLLVT